MGQYMLLKIMCSRHACKSACFIDKVGLLDLKFLLSCFLRVIFLTIPIDVDAIANGFNLSERRQAKFHDVTDIAPWFIRFHGWQGLCFCPIS